MHNTVKSVAQSLAPLLIRFRELPLGNGLFPNPIQMRIGSQKNRAIDHRRRCQSAAFPFVGGQQLELLAGGDDGGRAFFIQQIDAAVGECR